MPRLAVDAYWRAHAIRADRLARALASAERRAAVEDLPPADPYAASMPSALR